MPYIAKARIAYNGPALEQGLMDVRELAPALLAFADLINHVNDAIGGDRKIRVMLNQDSLQKGSFDITTILDYSFFDQAKLFIGAAEESGLSALMEILGWGTAVKGGISGIFALIKKIGDRKIKKAEREDKNLVKLTLSDGDVILTTKGTMQVYINADSRKAMEKVIKPLSQDGIDSFELRNPDNPDDKRAIESINKEEAAYFKSPPISDDEKIEKLPEQEMTVKITSVNFEKGLKWRLTDGNNTFWAKIEDEEFLAKVDDHDLVFGNGDMLRVRYYVQQVVKNGNLSSEYVVTKVLEVKEKPQQIQLDFEMK